MPFKVVEQIATIPVSLAAAKLHIRYTGNLENQNVEQYINAAEQYCENRTWRKMLKAKILYTADNFTEIIELPRPPTVSVESVKYISTNGELTTLDASEYYIDLISEPARLKAKSAWPQTKSGAVNAVQIEYTAGYDNEDIPPQLLQALQMLVAHFFNQREAVAISGGTITVKDVPIATDLLLDMYSVRTP